MKTKTTTESMYDLLIIGAGPCGLAAAVNAASEGLGTLVIDSAKVIGGQAKFSSRVENYSGFTSGISGEALLSRFYHQALRFGATIRTNLSATKVIPEGRLFYSELSNREVIVARVILVACGLMPRKLPIEGLSTFEDKGVYYGAMPNEAEGKAGKNVTIIGGANSAGQAAVNFADYNANVTMLAREASLTSMSQYLIDQIAQRPNIRIVYNAQLQSANGGNRLESLTLKSGEVLPADFTFIFIGFEPKTDWIKTLCKCDDQGFLLSGANFMSSTKGIFVAGDVQKDSVKRIASAVGAGSQAVNYIHKYLTETWVK